MKTVFSLPLLGLVLTALLAGCGDKSPQKQETEAENNSSREWTTMKIEQNFYPDNYLSENYPYTQNERKVQITEARDGSKSEISISGEIALGIVLERQAGKLVSFRETYEGNDHSAQFSWDGNTGTFVGELGRKDELKVNANGQILEWGRFDQVGEKRNYYAFLHNQYNDQGQLVETVRWIQAGLYDEAWYCRYEYGAANENGDWTSRKALIQDVEYDTEDEAYQNMQKPTDLLTFPADFAERAKSVNQTREISYE